MRQTCGSCIRSRADRYSVFFFSRSRLRRLQRENAEFTAQKRAEALDAIALMTEHAQRRADQERASEGESTTFDAQRRLCVEAKRTSLSLLGLVIIAAQYGLSDAFSDGAERFDVSDKVFDVTIPLQALVQNGTLYIPEGRSKVRSISERGDLLLLSTIDELTTYSFVRQIS